jgi:glycosyltransferase involved in cell wall biosynthesis
MLAVFLRHDWQKRERVTSSGSTTWCYAAFPPFGRAAYEKVGKALSCADLILQYCSDPNIYIVKIPDCTLTVVGKNPPNDILSLRADPKVIVEANVKEVSLYYERALVSAVALRSGGGTRLKILESMAFGTPVVSTSIGCEGFEYRNGQDILIGDSP